MSNARKFTKLRNPCPAAAETGRPTPIIACTGAATIALPANRLRMLAPASHQTSKGKFMLGELPPELSCFFEHCSTCKRLQSQCSCSGNFGHKPQLWSPSQLVAVVCTGRHSALQPSCEQPHKMKPTISQLSTSCKTKRFCFTGELLPRCDQALHEASLPPRMHSLLPVSLLNSQLSALS